MKIFKKIIAAVAAAAIAITALPMSAFGAEDWMAKAKVIQPDKEYNFTLPDNTSETVDDIVNIALHISLKNFEQQCNGINIHSAMLRGYLFHCVGRRFACLIRVISAVLLSRMHSAYRRAYPKVIPIAHVIAPDHCFQLFYHVIRTSSATAVKQLILHSCPHTFAAGIVMTSASGTVHALPYSILVQRSSV